MLFSIASVLGFVLKWPTLVNIYINAGLFINFVLLYALIKQSEKKYKQSEGFKCPLVPLVPCLGLYSNLFLAISALARKDNTLVAFVLF